MKTDSMFKAYDCRGIYGKDVTEENAFFVGRTLRKFAKRVVSCMDYREHNLELATAFSAGYGEIEFMGHGPTSAALYNSGKETAVVFTASHNPVGYNGIKLLKDKRDYSTEELAEVKKEFNSMKGEYKGEKARLSEKPEMLEAYVNALPDCEGGIYDLCGGAVCAIKKKFSKTYFSEADPRYEKHAAEPTDQTLNFLKKETLKQNQVGYAFDGDGDRVVVVDKGVTIRPCDVAAFAAVNYLKKGDSIVLTLDNSQEVFDYLKDQGFKMYYSKVGHTHVEEKAMQVNAALHAEASSHFAVMKHMTYADCAYFALMLSGTKPGKFLEFSKNFKNHSILEKVHASADFTKIKEMADKGAEWIDTSDGVKAKYSDFTVLARPSNTEPIIRIFSEAKTKEKALEGLAKAKEWIAKARITSFS